MCKYKSLYICLISCLFGGRCIGFIRMGIINQLNSVNPEMATFSFKRAGFIGVILYSGKFTTVINRSYRRQEYAGFNGVIVAVGTEM